MEENKIGTTLPESWFIERIGKVIEAKFVSAFPPILLSFYLLMTIEDVGHASYLCHTCQKFLHYRFSEPTPFSKTN